MASSGGSRQEALTLDSSNNILVSSTAQFNATPTDYKQFVARLKSDGSGTGTYSVGGYSIVYASNSFTATLNSSITGTAVTVSSTRTLAGSVQTFATSRSNGTSNFSSAVVT